MRGSSVIALSKRSTNANIYAIIVVMIVTI